MLECEQNNFRICIWLVDELLKEFKIQIHWIQ